MAQCSSPADLSEATKTKKVAIITGITGQVTNTNIRFPCNDAPADSSGYFHLPATTVDFMVSSMETLAYCIDDV